MKLGTPALLLLTAACFGVEPRDKLPAELFESHLENKTLACAVDDSFARYGPTWKPGDPLPISEKKILKAARSELARHVPKLEDWTYRSYEIVRCKGGGGQHWYAVVSFEDSKAPLKGEGSSRRVRIPVNFAGFALALWVEASGENPFHILFWDEPEFDGKLLSPMGRREFDALKPGISREQLSKSFQQDGGVQDPLNQRYYLRDTPAPGRAPTVFMIEVFFKPIDMDQRTFSDPNLRKSWAREHRFHDKPEDIAEAFGRPYIHYPSFE